MAKASNSEQYAKVIDLGINAPMTGLFLPGSPYYTKTAYPAPDPKGAAKLVKQIEQADRPTGLLHPHRHEQPRGRAGRRSSSSRSGARPA